MSIFLGPIHYWMYEKIVNAWRRQGEILKTFRDEYGDEVFRVVGRNPYEYEKLNDGLPLEKIIGNNPIHGWLQGQIDLVEREEARLISVLIGKYGKAAIGIAKQGAFRFGVSCGDKALKENRDAKGDLSSAYELFLNYDLDGMPCDHVTEVEDKGEALAVKHYECLHYRNWSEIDVPFEGMCEIIRSWISGFFHALDVEHIPGSAIAKGSRVCEDIFKLRK